MSALAPYRKPRPMFPFDPFLELAFPWNGFFREGFSECRTDITDRGDHYLLEMDLPGFDKKDVALELKGGVLTVRAERHSGSEDKKEDCVRAERTFGSFSRTFDVSNVDYDAIRAKLENGVLTLTMPKTAEQKQEQKQLSID